MSKQEFLLLKQVRQRSQSLIKNKNTAGNVVTTSQAALSKNLRRQHFISLSSRVSEDIFQTQMNEITRVVLGSHKNSPSRYYSNPSTRNVPSTHFATSFGTGQTLFVAEGRRSDTGSLDRRISRQVQNLPKIFPVPMNVISFPKY